MANLHRAWMPFLSIVPVSFFSDPVTVMCYLQPQTYIIQVEKPIQSMDKESLKFWYNSVLLEESDDICSRLLHSYSEVFNGFAAELTDEELEELSKKKGFVRAFPDRMLSTHTTYTPNFLGLQLGHGLWNASHLGKGIIIGVLDTGVTPGHPSFDDEGMVPPPAKWKGSCHLKSGCNNKLIGAVSMTNNTIIDLAGHGTHTSATAAGNFVRNANSYGLAGGTAAGIAPRAHIAMYQVCGGDGQCHLKDVLAGMDAAVKDGVDVISMSLGFSFSPQLVEDLLAISAFRAMEKGIFVSCSGGNGGPDSSTISNDAPWVLTVAATTIDRRLRATIKLGNGKILLGESLDQSFSFTHQPLALSYNLSDPYCEFLRQSKEVKGKVVACMFNLHFTIEDAASSAKVAGALALICINTDLNAGSTLFDTRISIPSATISITDGSEIMEYVSASLNPTVSIFFDGTIFGVSPAPIVAYFSSRGPSNVAPHIIKPDISGPGVNILAAYPTIDGIENNNFKILCGTSMAAPHLSGIAALIKSVHPEWSPAAIKSAMITTTRIKDINGKPIEDQQQKPASFFDMGAGLVNPAKAVDPGLVYDMDVEEYIGYICGKLGSTGAKVITGKMIDCSKVKNISESELNYPSILLVVPQNGSVATITRTVTNVGPAKSSYTLWVQMQRMGSVVVSPKTLLFSEVNEKKSFNVSAKRVNKPSSSSVYIAGRLSWVSDKHVVSSPILISTST